MKSLITSLFALLFISLSISSCSKSEPMIEEKEEQVSCEFNDSTLIIDPICAFNPKVATTVNFPVRAMYNGVPIQHTEFEFLWSHDEDFGAGAISVNYEQLPITVTVTEISTGCVAVAELAPEHWD